MNSGPFIYLGLLLSMALSFWGLILSPQLKLGHQDLVAAGDMNQLYPSGPVGLAQRGADVYRSHGCAECHTQQVRPKGFGGDIDRGWGVRRTVAQDFLRSNPVMLGSLRMGPDLANIGARQPDASWHLNHLYKPKSMVPGSLMPGYSFLFEERNIEGHPSIRALQLTGDFVPEDGQEIVPTEDALALVAYLQSLRSDVSLYEAPLPPTLQDTNAAPDAPEVPDNPVDVE